MLEYRITEILQSQSCCLDHRLVSFLLLFEACFIWTISLKMSVNITTGSVPMWVGVGRRPLVLVFKAVVLFGP